jgi:hypothetical protein
LHFALESAGNNMAARIAMMAMTTSSSISVKPLAQLRRSFDFGRNAALVIRSIELLVNVSLLQANLQVKVGASANAPGER